MRKTILEVIVGSTVHGTSVNDGLEDLDLMSIVIEDAKDFIGFGSKDVWVERTKPQGVRSEAGDIDHVVYGLRKYLSLALKNNPTALLALFVPDSHVRSITDDGRTLRELAPSIVSKSAFGPFRGYLQNQRERLLGERGQRNVTRPELVAKYGFDAKFAGHAVRLGLQGEELLSTGRMSLPMRDADRELVVKVRTGGFSLPEVIDLIQESERRLEAAYVTSSLPDKPDVEKVERWMVDAYLRHWTMWKV